MVEYKCGSRDVTSITATLTLRSEVAERMAKNQSTICRIAISKGLFCLVSAEDVQRVSAFRWTADVRRGGKAYAYRFDKSEGTPKKIYMHRMIVESQFYVDHKDGNGLNNTRQNLREATASQNGRNRVWKKRTSRFTGVHWDSRRNKWCAQLSTLEGKRVSLGRFETELEAFDAWRTAIAIHPENKWYRASGLNRGRV